MELENEIVRRDRLGLDKNFEAIEYTKHDSKSIVGEKSKKTEQVICSASCVSETIDYSFIRLSKADRLTWKIERANFFLRIQYL